MELKESKQSFVEEGKSWV